MRSRDAWVMLLALVMFAATAHAAPKIEVDGGLPGDACAAQRTDDDDKRIILTVELAADGRVVYFEPPRRITDSTVAAINATLRACRWQPAPAPRRVPVRVWVPSDLLF